MLAAAVMLVTLTTLSSPGTAASSCVPSCEGGTGGRTSDGRREEVQLRAMHPAGAGAGSGKGRGDNVDSCTSLAPTCSSATAG